MREARIGVRKSDSADKYRLKERCYVQTGPQSWNALMNITVQVFASDDKNIGYILLIYFTRLYITQAQEHQC
jgi:hypothetical protein